MRKVSLKSLIWVLVLFSPVDCKNLWASEKVEERQKSILEKDLEGVGANTDTELETFEEFEKWIQTDQVIIEGLDKITARVFTAKVHVNQLVRFGTLEFYVRAAYKSAPEDAPDSACFLEIYNCRQGQEKESVFSGWMFASNPALSAPEHPVYDVWVKEAMMPQKNENGE